jgi:uracil-DNA glycosylase family 4
MLSDPPNTASPQDGASQAELIAMLRWHVDMGVDIAVGDEPRNYFAESAAKAAQKPAETPSEVEAPRPARIAPRLAPEPARLRPAPATAVTLAPDEAVAQARALAEGAQTLEELTAALAGFDGCVLKRSASHLVFAQTAPGARIIFVSDVPGEQDDREGRVLFGSPGLLFDAMLKSVGLQREQIGIVHTVPWRPPGNRDVNAHEIAACLPFLQRYLALVAPALVVTLGGLPAQHLLGAKEPLMRIRGKWFELALPDSQTIPALAMLHPDYLLKAPAAKKHAWSDLRALRRMLSEKGLA